MRNAPVPKRHGDGIFARHFIKKECIVNAFNILSTPIRHAKRVLPLVKYVIFYKKSGIFGLLVIYKTKKGGP